MQTKETNQLADDVLCKYCFGCERLRFLNFKGTKNCKNFIEAIDMTQYYKALKGEK